MSPFIKQALLIFIRNPLLGIVKTRLAKGVGNQNALSIYQHMLDHTRNVAAEFENADKFLFYDRFIPDFDNWNEAIFSKNLQLGKSIDQKVNNAFKYAFNLDYDRVIWIVPDCPKLHVGHIRNAFAGLNKHDVVIGPTHDNGIYLIGMKTFCPDLLDGQQWGQGTIIKNVQDMCKKKGLSELILPGLADVDEAQDLCYLAPHFDFLQRDKNQLTHT